jgi:hypothetical protein
VQFYDEKFESIPEIKKPPKIDGILCYPVALLLRLEQLQPFFRFVVGFILRPLPTFVLLGFFSKKTPPICFSILYETEFFVLNLMTS